MRSALSKASVEKKSSKKKAARSKAKPRVKKVRKYSVSNSFPGLSTQEQIAFEKLRDFRQRLAKRRRVPAFKVLHDATLVEMIKSRPSSNEEFSELHGVGVAKVKKYAKLFIEFLEEEN